MTKKGFYSVEKLIILIFILGIGLIAYFFVDGAGGKEKIPPQFLEARQNASAVSGQIVDLTTRTNEKIKAVNLSDLSGNAGNTLSFIQEARNLNSDAYVAAFELSRQLQKMAESLEQIKSLDTRQEAYEAVAVELALVSEFISYTQSLNNFLDSLTKAIAMESSAERGAGEKYLTEVNEKTATINNLNQEFSAKIRKFDESF